MRFSRPLQFVSLFALIVLLLSVSTFFAQGQSGGISFDEEMNITDLPEEETFHEVLNCFYDTTLLSILERSKEKYEENTSEDYPLELPEVSQIKCDDLPPIANAYRDKLEELLDETETNLQKPEDLSGIPDDLLICNLDLDENLFQDSPEEGDYFEFQKGMVRSPAYAYSIVSYCYRIVYEYHLEKYQEDAYDTKSLAESLGRTSLSQEEVVREGPKRRSEVQKELRIVEFTIGDAVYDLDTRTKNLITWSELEEQKFWVAEFRDLLRRIRIPIEQLETTLPGQSIGD